MKIAITGTTSGLGEHLAQHLVTLDHTIIHLNRKDGFDITTPMGLDLIYAQSANADVFVNNAYPYDAYPNDTSDNPQRTLLNGLAHRWTGTDKLVISICSRMALLSMTEIGKLTSPYLRAYAFRKADLLDTHTALVAARASCRLSILIPGLFDTPRSRADIERRGASDREIMTLDDVVAALVYIIASPSRTNIGRLELAVNNPIG